MSNDFELAKNYLKNILGEPTFEKWIKPLSYIGTKNSILFMGSPDAAKTTWIKNNILEKINKHLRKEFKLVLKLVPLYDEEGGDDVVEEPLVPSRPTPADGVLSPGAKGGSVGSNSGGAGNQGVLSFPGGDFSRSTNLQTKYTFENFVQVDQNRMAYSFSHNVAEFPGKSYNPLYIYSDVGLGKTHLMYAIGNRIIRNNENIRVIYSTTSEFMHEYVEFNRLNKRPDFIKKYTSVDVLLIDDIQYITRWGGTSEQFYYIFNKLIQQGKQIVICSDKHPDNIPDLEHRIKSRFEWGGIVDILHYDLEGRLAILKNKLAERRYMIKNDFKIPDDVLYFLASSIKDNVRKLEGALNRLIGVANLKYSDSRDTVISLEFARDALKPIVSPQDRVVTIDQIRDFVAQKYSIKSEDLVSKSNRREISHPRQIAMYLCKKLTGNPLNEIGGKFGGKHHSTVLHSINKIQKAIDSDPEFAREIHFIVKFFE